MITSCVRELGGVPTLFIDEQPVPGMAYITYFRGDACYEQFIAAGYRHFSIPVYFGDQTINATSGILPFEPGIFSEKGRADFTILDRQVEQILEICPDALIFPRVNMAVPRWWEDEHPDECCDIGFNGTPRRSCFSSQKWREDTREMLRQFLEYAEAAPYGQRLFAYMLADGNTEEWFSFDQRGSIGPAARKNYSGNPDPDDPAFRRYLSHAAASAICEFAQAAKEFTHHRKAIGCFYGYTYEVPFWSSNHHALRDVLNCPDVDFICSPASYVVRNSPGVDWPNMLPIDSVQAAGKLYFMENDTRTSLSKLLNQSHPGACPGDAYDRPIWHGPDSEEKSIHLLRMNFARQIADAHASWWFDMWGGWYDSPAMMDELAQYLQIAQRFLWDQERKAPAQCACWIDECAYAYAEPAKEGWLAKQSRIAIGQCGVPCDFFEIGDFRAQHRQYLCHIFVVYAETDAVKAAIHACRELGAPVLILRPGEVPAPKELREFCIAAGAHCYCHSDDAIHVAPHFLAIHAASDGVKEIHLPHAYRITPLVDSGEEVHSECLRLEMKIGETKMFRLEEGI